MPEGFTLDDSPVDYSRPDPGPHDLDLSPATFELQRRYGKLQEEFGKLVSERDLLVTTIIPNLETDYQVKLGGREYKLFGLQVGVRRMKRKIELMQASLNRGEKPDIEAVEKQIGEEFEKWRKEMEELHARIEKANTLYGTEKLSEEDSGKLRKLYRSMVMKLHPDINPGLRAQAKNVWLRVVDAYKDGDLNELEVLSSLVDNMPGAGEKPMPTVTEQLCAEMEKKIQGLIDRIAALKAKPPYTMGEDLADEEWVLGKQGELDAAIEEARAEGKAVGDVLGKFLA